MKHKLLLIFGVLALLVSVISLIILIVGLEVAPGHQRLVDRQMVNTVKSLIWFFGLVGGSLIGWAMTLRVRSRRNLSLLIPSILLILWSIERLFLGIAPEYDSFYGFSAVIAAIIMIVIVTLGGFLVARWLSSRLTSSETIKKVAV